MITVYLAVALAVAGKSPDQGLTQQNEALFRRLQEAHGLTEGAMRRIREIFARSGYLGQGNPALSQHPMTEAACQRARLERATEDPREAMRICGAPHMAPLYDPSREDASRARVCIDVFEFPDVPCAYPVVWVRAREAAQICEAMDKRLCDAHEWEGACVGRLEPPDYQFDMAAGAVPEAALRLRRRAHNAARAGDRSWSYGPAYRKGVCGTASHKSDGCPGGGWSQCGSNTYPTGAFPDCRSPLGVFDLHGNAAEHMNLPLDGSQMASRGSREYGYTEMKGSWFSFDDFHAHEDWCRWRAPYWHGSRVMDPRSHANYHLGFRCCKTIGPAADPPALPEGLREDGTGSPAPCFHETLR